MVKIEVTLAANIKVRLVVGRSSQGQRYKVEVMLTLFVKVIVKSSSSRSSWRLRRWSVVACVVFGAAATSALVIVALFVAPAAMTSLSGHHHVTATT